MKRKLILVASIVLLVAVGAGFWATKAYGQSYRRVEVPKYYGTFKGAVGGSLLFEASDGTLYVVEGTSGNLQLLVARK